MYLCVLYVYICIYLFKKSIRRILKSLRNRKSLESSKSRILDRGFSVKVKKGPLAMCPRALPRYAQTRERLQIQLLAQKALFARKVHFGPKMHFGSQKVILE